MTKPVLNSEVVKTPGRDCIVLKISGSAKDGCAFRTRGDKVIRLGSILFNLSISSAESPSN